MARADLFEAYNAMSTDLKRQISAEIERIQQEIRSQKALIKDSVDKPLTLETATQEMKALHTRLAVLEANLATESARVRIEETR